MQWPAPSTTHSRGASTRCTGISVSCGDAQVEAAQHAAAADEVDAPHDEVLGQLGRRLAEAGDDRVDDGATLVSSMASRTSSGERITVLGRPLMRSRPRTSALYSSSVGHAEPMVILISSAVRSPMAMPYSRRM